MRDVLRSKKWLAALAVCIALAGVACWQRTPVLTWYYLRELAVADTESRETWVRRTVSLDAAAVPGLLAHLENRDPTVCINAESALTALVQRWGAEDARTHALAGEIHQRFGTWSPLGQISGLQVMAGILQGEGPKVWPASLTRTAGELLHVCRERAELRTAALELAGALLDRAAPGQWLDTCRMLADKGLHDRFPRARLAAVQLVMRAPLQTEPALLAKVAPLLRDDEPRIRRAALLAVASARDLVSEDELLPLLHDSDVATQHLCEAALRSRGLSDAHIELARLVGDESPAARLKVLERLGRVSDLDPSSWVRRLTQDPSAAVRAAAVRAAAQLPRGNLADRLREMAGNDPSETVRQNALHYLRPRPVSFTPRVDAGYSALP